MYRLRQSTHCFRSNIDLRHVMFQLFEMSIQILVDNLWRQINPNVKNSVFIRFIFETVLQVDLHTFNDRCSPLEVMFIPITIGLVVGFGLCASRSVRKQVVKEFNRQCRNVFKFSKNRNIDVLTACDIQKNTVHEKQKCFYIKVLSPTQAKVKEELSQTFVVNTRNRFFLFFFLHSAYLL